MRKLSPLHQTQMACFTALLAPVAGVCAVGAFDRLAPRSSVASPAGAAPLVVPPSVPKPVSKSQKNALEWLSSNPPVFPIVRSPLEARQEAAVTPTTTTTAPTEPDAEPALEVPAFRLTLLMLTWEESVASIDGALYREGDEIRDGWRVVWIDVSARAVRLLHTSGASVELHCD